MLNQIEIFDIPSPCKRICETDKQGYCVACYRSRNERFDWMKYNDEEKQNVLRLCRQRELRKKYFLLQQYKLNTSSEIDNTEQLDLF